MNSKPDFPADFAAPSSTSTHEHRRASTNARMPNAAEGMFAGRNTVGTSKPRPNGAAVIKALFNAAKAILSAKDEPRPQARRRRGKTDKGFAVAWRRMLRRAAKSDPAARGRYAALQPAREAPADAYASVCTFLADTLDWLNLWQDNAGNENWLEDDFSAKHNQNFPQF